MQVRFIRTGERRYGVSVTAAGQQPREMDSAPGYDPDIPHDLVHYLVEAELKLTGGVFGRLAAGGGSLFPPSDDIADHRERRRRQRRQHKREERLRREDRAGSGEMGRSEYVAAICEVAWKSRNGRLPEVPAWAVPDRLSSVDHAHVERVLARLDRAARLWRPLAVGGSLAFTWPDPEPHQDPA